MIEYGENKCSICGDELLFYLYRLNDKFICNKCNEKELERIKRLIENEMS